MYGPKRTSNRTQLTTDTRLLINDNGIVGLANGVHRTYGQAWSPLALMTRDSSCHLAVECQCESGLSLQPGHTMTVAAGCKAGTTSDASIRLYRDEGIHQSPFGFDSDAVLSLIGDKFAHGSHVLG